MQERLRMELAQFIGLGRHECGPYENHHIKIGELLQRIYPHSFIKQHNVVPTKPSI